MYVENHRDKNIEQSPTAYTQELALLNEDLERLNTRIKLLSGKTIMRMEMRIPGKDYDYVIFSNQSLVDAMRQVALAQLIDEREELLRIRAELVKFFQ